ncbi:MAG TPA: cytochrome c biogenesis CcdA family protein [Candidatus Binatia bacterium]|nr:cytochrome c biogenesis CcdA family protein [Candidatus Binatia bacterium]
MSGELSFGLAVVAGVLSFLSPCVLPLVPAYLGQLTAVAVAGAGSGRPSRWLALRHAAAYVAGFTTVFTFLGVTATFAAGPLFDYIAPARTIGGAILVVLGASLAGLVRLPLLERVWRPLEPAAQAGLAGRTGGLVVAVEAPTGTTSGLGRWLAQTRSGPLVSFALGAIFAVGWTPCIGVVLGAILTLAANSATVGVGGLLLVGFSLGLGVPFLALGLLYDRAPALVRPLVRRGRLVSLLGGLLVAAIGLAMIFDWLVLLPRWFGFFSLV